MMLAAFFLLLPKIFFKRFLGDHTESIWVFADYNCKENHNIFKRIKLNYPQWIPWKIVNIFSSICAYHLFFWALTDTGENVQKWTRVFSTRHWVILVARTCRKKEENSVSTFGRFRLRISFESSPVSVKG